ncbi:uncharacterized protein MELLADRAFT_68353 [Melampsora larici-populina 98AG31]|uniref:Uncharacterized protein n=1 Tax=Melampsora larici-populina (strain 98AG31 / pathotype 3-4-7) TaxID=747676 RepID=F4S6H6_MELLP|nr:uncharacterized protein MELLADRAFT_68353 [Melampsora larici-populina 98AG31]EGF99757.1 hypothetical protein MELLADRAFT_68353 [Melampsora larici-populina 98AG31]
MCEPSALLDPYWASMVYSMLFEKLHEKRLSHSVIENILLANSTFNINLTIASQLKITFTNHQPNRSSIVAMLKSSLPKTPRSETVKGLTNSKKKNHPFYISSLFDMFAQLESDVQGTWGFRHSHMTIVTWEPDAEDSMGWVIRGSAYGGVKTILEVDGVYFFKGRLIALNQPGKQKFYYEPKNQIFATTSRDLKGDISNSVSVFGLGVIISRKIKPVSAGKDTIVVVVRHTDYNPEVIESLHIRALSSFDVQYRCPWSPLMEKLQPLLIPNREVQLIGHIVGKDMSKHMWVVEGSSKDLDVKSCVEQEQPQPPKKRARAPPVRNAVKTPNKKGKKTASPGVQNPVTKPKPLNYKGDAGGVPPNTAKGKGKALLQSVEEEKSVAEDESDED